MSSTTAGVGVARASALFVGRGVRHSVRDVESLLMAVILPVVLMVMFTYVFGGAMDVGGDYITYVTPGIILLCAGFGASTTAVGVARDMTTGTIDRLRTLPIPAATMLVGHAVASLLRNLLATAMVVLVAVGLGYRPAAGVGGWLGALGLIALWIAAITAVFTLIGLVASGPDAASGYGFALLFLPYLSSAFVPVETMPVWLRGFSEHQPITPLIESVRTLLGGGAPGGTAVVAVVWTVGIIVAAVVGVAVLFPRRTSAPRG